MTFCYLQPMTVTRTLITLLPSWSRLRKSMDGGVGVTKLRKAFTRDSGCIETWIEWRSNGDVLQGSFEDKVARLRVMALAQMLSNKEPQRLAIPDCVGYVDEVRRSRRYGWIFSMPENSYSNTALQSLNDLLGQARYQPTLLQRMALAWKLASTAPLRPLYELLDIAGDRYWRAVCLVHNCAI